MSASKPEWGQRHRIPKRADNGKFAPQPKCNLPPLIREGEIKLRAVDWEIEPAGEYVVRAAFNTLGWGAKQSYPVIVLDPIRPTALYFLFREGLGSEESRVSFEVLGKGGPVFCFIIGKNKARNYYRPRYFVGTSATRIMDAFFREMP